MFKEALLKLNKEYKQELDFLDQDLDDATITYDEYTKWVKKLRSNYDLLYLKLYITYGIKS